MVSALPTPMGGTGMDCSLGEWLEDLISTSGDLILIAQADGCVLRLSPSCCTALGCCEADVLRQNLVHQMAAADRAAWAAQVARVLASGESEAVRFSLLDHAGHPLPVRGNVGLWRRDAELPLLRLILQPLPPSGDLPVQPALIEGQIQARTADLQRSRLLLQEAQRIAQVGSWSLDLRRGELLWSDEIYRIFELDPAAFEPSYETFLGCVHPDDRRKVDEAYSRSLIDRQPYEVTHRLLMPDGRVKVVIERCETSFTSEGEPLLSIGTARDITEQTLARERLEQGERKLRSLVQLAPFGIVLSGLDGELMEWNEAFAAMIGVEPGRQIPPNLASLVPAHQHQLMDQQRQQLLRLGQSGPMRCEWLRLDSRPFQVKVSALLMLGSDSGPQVWSIVEDITESLRIQDQLEQAASVFSHSHEGIIITDAAGKILDVNQALCGITGYRREQLLGSNPRRLKSGLHDDAFYSSMWKALQECGSWSGEVINRARDGTLLPVRETISAVQGTNGVTHRYVALLTDIRQLKEQQQQLQDLALRDSLTGLANRLGLMQRLEQAIVPCRHGDVAVLMVGLLDIDGFKQVNDLHGHAAGDHLLQVLAKRMVGVLRQGDILARLGGDEFVLLLPGLAAMEQARPLIQRLLFVLRQPVPWGHHQLQVSGSLGLTSSRAGSAGSPAELLRQADQAMYAAKRSSGDRCMHFDHCHSAS